MDPKKHSARMMQSHVDNLKWWHCLIVVLTATGIALAAYRFGAFDIDAATLAGVSDFLRFWIGFIAWMAKWVITPLVIVVGVLYYILMGVMLLDKLGGEREYKEVDGRLFCRHAGGDWLEVDRHMREDHPDQ